MRIDKFTQKGQEALLEAQNLAQKYSQSGAQTGTSAQSAS